MKLKLFLFNLLFISLSYLGFSQTNAPSIQSGVTFNWSDNQTHRDNPATIESITVNGTLYYNFGVPSAYELTQLGPGGHDKNKIRLNGNFVENSSANATWNTSALAAYQSLNLNHYFDSNGNGDNICDDYTAEETTNAQRQTLYYGDGIKSNSSGLIAITERNANNCYHLEFFGIPFGGSVEQSLGETFVNQGNATEYGFGGTGTGANLGTPGAVDPPVPGGRDYWLSDRVVDTGGTIGIALFYLDNIAPFGSTITKVQLTAATNDNGDGKLFILTFPDSDEDSLSNIDDLDDDNDGILDTVESGGIDPSADHDVDGVPNFQDADFCTLNSSGICANLDFDSDGIPNHLDLDSDNDGLTDVLESGGTDDNGDGIADGVIGKDTTTFGVPSSAGTGTVPTNTDNSGNFDALDIDSDDDGIPDNVEAQSTIAYNAPSGSGLTIVDIDKNGIDDNYGNGLRPEDSDGDRVYDYIDSDSDNDTIPDIQENGMANNISGNDSDADGLDNSFETNGVNDVLLDVNEGIEVPSSLLILPDTDGDLYSGGDLDYRDLFDVNPPVEAFVDFDGVDDYLSTDRFIEGEGKVTIMAWVKADTQNGVRVIAGEDSGCRLWLQDGNKPTFTITTDGNATKSAVGNSISTNEWHHITGTYSNTTGLMSIYVDGVLDRTRDTGNDGSLIKNSTSSNDAFEIGRYSANIANQLYFDGSIDEVRVFDIALTQDQIQRMVYQEIHENASYVCGSVIAKDIRDITTDVRIPWSNLIAYYPMTAIKNSTTEDNSGNSRTLKLRNITTVQAQTAPMPYESVNNGSWTTESTWLHGDVWDIEDVNSNKDWSIVRINSNVSTSNSHTQLGMIVESGHTLSVNGDNYINNSWYLELKGAIDLADDSQLLQTQHSDLVTSSTGRILRRQEGNTSVYWYNYWSSPVGQLGSSTLTDNNTNTNNTNNTAYRLSMLKEGDGSSVTFTSAHDELGKVSTRWLYTYKNGVEYWDWASLSSNSDIEPGVGYTQKGTGNSGSSQQFIFEGKPNNGTILIDVTDTGGSGSVPAVSKTDYLFGNPYASALDIHKFIDDNAGVIDGTIQLWQQWSGTSHNLDEYDGGYAQVNKLGSVRAYQFVGIEGDTNGNQDGTKTPTRYLPVGQGFMTEIVADGTVEFNNSQRVFKKESDHNGSYNNGSVFFRTGQAEQDTDTQEAETEEQLMQKLRLEFSSVDGPATRKELLLGFSNYTSDDYDYGYDAKHATPTEDDLHLVLEGDPMSMQAYGPITEDKVVPLTLRASGAYNYRIRLTELIDIEEDQQVYLRDNLTGYYFDLRTDQAYEFSTESGEYANRFEIVFESEEATLSAEQEDYQYYLIYFTNNANKLFAKHLTRDVDQLQVINILGQTVREYTDVSATTLDNGLEISNLSRGTYVVYLKMGTHVETKKIVIN
ncbi:LamG-like jellyroll fold domain-containing protein [uncultured Psychroserpens sp.]|uniref:LamG-like jellyroll fold domain-containing protein n=1 Tax=uncultured Psychroserpens sp. TaxID=255436 RepID=UPI0026260DA9|nr:LamG-like jellyroll fold domain-containing protein [uncultured Psychroserpens sp.]